MLQQQSATPEIVLKKVKMVYFVLILR